MGHLFFVFPTISCCRLPGVGVGWGCCSEGRASICWSGKWGGTGTQQGFLQPLFSRADGILVFQRADASGQCHWTAPRPARVVSVLGIDLRRHNTTGAWKAGIPSSAQSPHSAHWAILNGLCALTLIWLRGTYYYYLFYRRRHWNSNLQLAQGHQ